MDNYPRDKKCCALSSLGQVYFLGVEICRSSSLISAKWAETYVSPFLMNYRSIDYSDLSKQYNDVYIISLPVKKKLIEP